VKQAAGFLQGGSPFRLTAIPEALNAVLSRGESYEAVPPGRRFEPDRLAGYYMDFRAKTSSETSPDELLPAALAQLGLGWWERLLDGDSAAETHVLDICRRLRERSVAQDDELRWLHDVPIPKYRVEPPWSSALAQGQIASLFLRAASLHDDEDLRDGGRRAAQPLLSSSTTDLVTITTGGRVLEEAPTQPHSHILNGWISALWGVLDVAIAFDDETAYDVYTSGWRCVRDLLPHYDTGWWTKYSLYPSRPADLAKPIYHRFQVDQLRVLASLTGDPVFAGTADRWSAYDTPINRARFLAQKTTFVLAFARGRLHVGEPPLPII
jgi:heparosan-N-sulfate-glucuronate 5-epimerase